jgi:hypothetical protein
LFRSGIDWLDCRLPPRSLMPLLPSLSSSSTGVLGVEPPLDALNMDRGVWLRLEAV